MPTIAPHLCSIVNEDGAVILDIPADKMIRLNATGAYVWKKLQEGLTVEELVRALATETATNPAVVARDVHAFLETLESREFLQN
jgi:hypothetical protein